MSRDCAAEIEQAIDEVMSNECAAAGPGAGVAVVRDGRIVHAKGYGLANVEWNQPISPTTLFAIGSLTKQFTAVAICMLYQEGKLDFDSQLSDVLTDYGGANGEATLRQLLHHTSGIRNYSPRSTQADFRKHVLLGAVIERVSGLRYHEFIESRIFEPLEMGASCLLLDGPVKAQRASSYWRDDNHGVKNWPFVSMTWAHAAGALGSTLEDLVKWDQGLRSHALLSASTSELMHHPARLNNGEECPYGFGLGLGSYLGCLCTHHAGGIAGFVSQIRSLYDPDLTVILLANYRTAPFDRITRMIDFQQCVAWYRGVLGLKPVGLHDDPFCLMVLPEGDTAFALDGTNPVLGGSNCIPNVLVDSLVVTVDELRARGVEFAREVQEDDEEGYAIATIKDCEGNLINIYENR